MKKESEMGVVYVCDFCGKDINGRVNDRAGRLVVTVADPAKDVKHIILKRLDACSGCADKLGVNAVNAAPQGE